MVENGRSFLGGSSAIDLIYIVCSLGIREEQSERGERRKRCYGYVSMLSTGVFLRHRRCPIASAKVNLSL